MVALLKRKMHNIIFYLEYKSAFIEAGKSH